MEKNRIKVKVKLKCYGGVRIENNERDFLSLPSKFLIFPEVNIKDTELTLEVSLVKAGWDRGHNRAFNSKREEVTDLEQLDSKKSVDDLLDEHRAGESYKYEEKSLSFANMIPSDLRNNPRVIFAKPRHEKEEVEYTKRATMGTQEILKYLEICEAQPENLSKRERWGMRNLNKRINKLSSAGDQPCMI